MQNRDRAIAPGARDEAERSRMRRAARPYLRWYTGARWKRLRAAQLAKEPLCRNCQKYGLTVPATICDHILPHRGDPEKFWSGPFQSLCASCHSTDKQREELGAPPKRRIGHDGWPL